MYALDHALIATPIGMTRVEGDDSVLTRVQIGAAERPRAAGVATAMRQAVEQLESYFSCKVRYFNTYLPKIRSTRGAALRDRLIAVGYGDTVSYGELAQRLDSGPRAIGQLCARNPLPIIAPCHRVPGAGGVLGSYSAGGGPATKQWLLDHERRQVMGER